jgi:two-component system, OmpR family, alkaline phosphatase synthesis response regulator PhoP
MRDAWIYANDREATSELARSLAELGFSPRHVGRNGALVPSGEDGASVRMPALALIVATTGEPPPNDLWNELRELEELSDVPLVLALEPEHLGSIADVTSAHELLVTPFTPAELRARIARARRDASQVEGDEVVRAGTLELNLVTYQVTIDAKVVSFAYMEYELLKFLMMHPGRVFSREALLRRVWGYDYYGGARTVDVHIRRVRAKLGQEHAARIKTIRSVGYLFEAGAVRGA